MPYIAPYRSQFRPYNRAYAYRRLTAFASLSMAVSVRELGFSCQRPTGRAIQRNEPAIREWKQRQWPALKKTPKNVAKP